MAGNVQLGNSLGEPCLLKNQQKAQKKRNDLIGLMSHLYLVGSVAY
jgi:hypothetical protein